MKHTAHLFHKICASGVDHQLATNICLEFEYLNWIWWVFEGRNLSWWRLVVWTFDLFVKSWNVKKHSIVWSLLILRVDCIGAIRLWLPPWCVYILTTDVKHLHFTDIVHKFISSVHNKCRFCFVVILRTRAALLYYAARRAKVLHRRCVASHWDRIVTCHCGKSISWWHVLWHHHHPTLSAQWLAVSLQQHRKSLILDVWVDCCSIKAFSVHSTFIFQQFYVFVFCCQFHRIFAMSMNKEALSACLDLLQ